MALRKSKDSFPVTRKYLSDPRSMEWEGWSWCPNYYTSAFSPRPVSTLAGHCVSGPRHFQLFMPCVYLTKPLRVFPVLSCSFPFPFSLFPPLPSRGKNITDILKAGEKSQNGNKSFLFFPDASLVASLCEDQACEMSLQPTAWGGWSCLTGRCQHPSTCNAERFAAILPLVI